MPLPQITHQLPLELDLPAPEEEGGIGQDEARQRSEASRKSLDAMFGKSDASRWLDEYLELVRGGWPWRVAAYITWASTPSDKCEPRTQQE